MVDTSEAKEFEDTTDGPASEQVERGKAYKTQQ